VSDRGLFIAFEGIDGAGTTTQAARLVEWLRSRGEAVHPTREPSDGPIGVLIRQVLRHRVVVHTGEGASRPLDPGAVALLFAADRLDHLDAEVEPRLARGVHVVSDRYVGSSLAYQATELDLGWVSGINGRASAPDLTVLLRIDAGAALLRVGARGSDRELYEREETLLRVTALYDRLVADGLLANPLVIDATRGIDDIAAEIRAAVQALESSRAG
jgi:dTMP kinase